MESLQAVWCVVWLLMDQGSVAWPIFGVSKNGKARWRRAESELLMKDSSWTDFFGVSMVEG